MPIYEFYCSDCHTIFSFLARTSGTSKRPACPRCARPKLERRASAFAISKGRTEPVAGAGPDADIDDARMERAMAELASEAEGMSEDDPRQMARLMRKLYDATGMPLESGVEEAIRRLEAGEDPDRIEEEMGDVLERADPFGGEGPGAEDGTAGRAARLRRRYLPPAVDRTLYEL